MKILTMCGYGHNRSVAAAYILSHDQGHETVAVGHRHGQELRAYLYAWADRIVVMEPHYARYVPAAYAGKVRVCNVGPDVYGDPRNVTLSNHIKRWIVSGGLE